MIPTDIYRRLLDRFGAKTILRFLASDLSDKRNPIVYDPPQILAAPERVAEIGQFCRDDEPLRFDALMCLSAVDRGASLSVVYSLHSLALGHKLTLRVDVPRRDPRVPTVETVWKTANWHEREAADLMGILFEGHSDPRPLILPEGWIGHPLRKDYQVQEFYRGIKVPY